MTNETTNYAVPLIKRIEQTELNEACKLIADCSILPVKLIKAFLKKRGKKDNQIENILNQIVKRKLAFYDESKTYLKSNSGFTSADINAGYVKSLWLILDLIKNVNEYFIQRKTPHTMTFFNSSAEDLGGEPVYDIFYVPYDSEKLNEYIINNMALQSMSTVHCFIIIDSETEIEKFCFNDKIDVVSYVTVSSDGEICYIGNGEEK